MDEAPNYRFYRHPRFSANHLADYLCTDNASQRDGVIRKAKFPRKVAVVAYQQATPAMRHAFTARDTSAIADHIERLKKKMARETGYPSEEAERCVAALEAFRDTYAKARWAKIQFVDAPRDVAMKVEGVTINMRLDPPLIEQGRDDSVHGGGCVMWLASTPESRKNIEFRRKYVAAIVHWGLEANPSNIEVAPRLCMSFDVFGKEIVKAPTAYEMLRKRMTDSCREVVAKWDGIAPPQGYDGPDWR